MRLERRGVRYVMVSDGMEARHLCEDCYAVVDKRSGQVLEVKHCDKCVGLFKTQPSPLGE